MQSKKHTERISFHFNSFLNSYSQIFFAKNKFFAAILVIVSFLDWWMGVAGVVSILVANLVAYYMGFNKKNISDGIYGFNSLLVGLGIGIYFAASWNVIILVVFAALMTLFVGFVLEGVMAKYGLPFLSLPFLFSIWLLTISFYQFNNFGLGINSIYRANELYTIGGLALVKAFEWLNNLAFPLGLKIYFQSLGAIFFQYNIFAGILISIGLFLHSRQAFLMSLFGFYVAFFFYDFIGLNSSSLSVTYYGFNFILSAIAIGSYFLIPTFESLLWTFFLIPVLALITIGADNIFANFNLSVYSLPFNIAVLGFIYSLKLRITPGKGLNPPIIQQKNPEQNVYLYRNNGSSLLSNYMSNFSLPFHGKWSINQGFNGEITHKDAWKFAWDFVIIDSQNKEYKNEGNFVEDYFCYNKPIIAPADGTVVEIIDGIDDNIIGEINIRQNWGNSIVIFHGYGIYSQCSHIKSGSFKVTKGSFVKQGQILGNAGNSGRSPFPHLHFQFQTSYIVGSKTFEIPFNNYILFGEGKKEYIKSDYPLKGQIISNIEASYNIMRMLKFVPGDVIDLEFWHKNKMRKVAINSDIDIFNNTFLNEANSENYLYFQDEKVIFKGLNYLGSKKSPLYFFFNSLYFIPLGFYKAIVFKDYIPVNINHCSFVRFIQDFLVNFGIFIQTEYNLKYKNIDNENNPNNVDLEVQINNKIFKRTISTKNVKIQLSLNDLSTIEYSSKNKINKIIWKKR